MLEDLLKISIELDDVLELKKQHPCGSNLWQVVRSGTDCKIKCLGCGRIIMVDRLELKKMIKTKKTT